MELRSCDVITSLPRSSYWGRRPGSRPPPWSLADTTLIFADPQGVSLPIAHPQIDQRKGLRPLFTFLPSPPPPRGCGHLRCPYPGLLTATPLTRLFAPTALSGRGTPPMPRVAARCALPSPALTYGASSYHAANAAFCSYGAFFIHRLPPGGASRPYHLFFTHHSSLITFNSSLLTHHFLYFSFLIANFVAQTAAEARCGNLRAGCRHKRMRLLDALS